MLIETIDGVLFVLAVWINAGLIGWYDSSAPNPVVPWGPYDPVSEEKECQK